MMRESETVTLQEINDRIEAHEREEREFRTSHVHADWVSQTITPPLYRSGFERPTASPPREVEHKMSIKELERLLFGDDDEKINQIKKESTKL